MQGKCLLLFRRVKPVLLSVMLLAALLASQSRPARAQGFDVSYAFDVSIEGLRPGDIACVGEPVHFTVSLQEMLQDKETRVSYMLYIDASNTQGRGQFISDRQLLGFDFTLPDSVVFTYEPSEEGEEQVFFETLVPTSYSLAADPILVSTPILTFTVDDCPPKVEGAWNWRYPVPGLTMIGTGEMPETKLEAQDESGTLFAGSGPFTFSYIQLWDIPTCWVTLNDTTSELALIARLTDDTLDVEMNFGAATLEGTGGCIDIVSSASQAADYNQLGVSEFSVPASGGVVTEPTTAGGLMTFVVTREPEVNS